MKWIRMKESCVTGPGATYINRHRYQVSDQRAREFIEGGLADSDDPLDRLVATLREQKAGLLVGPETSAEIIKACRAAKVAMYNPERPSKGNKGDAAAEI